MIYEAIDTVVLACTNPTEATRPYERLGLCVSPGGTLVVGDASNLFGVEIVGPGHVLYGHVRPVPVTGNLAAVALRVTDLDAALQNLAAKGIGAPAVSGAADWRGAWLPLHERAGTDLVLLQRRLTTQERHASAERQGLLAHKLPLRRLDHLAAVTVDLDDKTHFWTDVLGVPVSGEVVTPTLIIRQLKIGDAVLELLGAASADSPIRKRPPGLVSMVSWQVPDLDAAVPHVRNVGFTVTDAAAGALPGTRFATVQGSELSGVNMQLLQYV